MKTHSHNFIIKSYWTLVDDITSAPIVIFSEDGQLIGSCILHFANWSCVMMDLHVAENWRRMGVATEILKHAIEKIKTSSVKSLTVYVAEKNNAAVQFYIKNGFFVCDERDGDIFMTKKI